MHRYASLCIVYASLCIVMHRYALSIAIHIHPLSSTVIESQLTLDESMLMSFPQRACWCHFRNVARTKVDRSRHSISRNENENRNRKCKCKWKRKMKMKVQMQMKMNMKMKMNWLRQINSWSYSFDWRSKRSTTCIHRRTLVATMIHPYPSLSTSSQHEPPAATANHHLPVLATSCHN